MYKKLLPFIFVIILTVGFSVFAQSKLPDIGIQKTLALGIVRSVGEKKVVIETKDGMLDVILLGVTGFKRLPPDNLSLKAATDASFSDISVGDRVLVTGKVSEDKTNILTKTVYLVKNSDIQASRAKEIQEWRRRGISGKVALVDAEARIITVEIRSITGAPTKMQITPKEKIKYLRYSSNSIKYKDAVESDFSAIKTGDMLRALGDRSEDRTSFKAEQILTGAFQTVAGTIKSVDVENNEVTITDLKSKKDVTIIVNKASLLKKFPAEIAQRLARRQLMMRMRAAGARPPTKSKSEGNRSGNSDRQQTGNAQKSEGTRQRSGGSGGGRRGGGDINDMLNRFPTIKVADLKVGDMIAVSSPKGADPTRITAIKLLAGVEPFLKAPKSPGGRSGRRTQGRGLTIPGLDSVDF